MIYEICLSSGEVEVEAWVELLRKIRDLHRDFQKWRLVVREEETVIRYYLETTLEFPTTLGLKEFYFCPTKIEIPRLKARGLRCCFGDYITVRNYLMTHGDESLKCVEVTGFRVVNSEYTRVKMRTNRGDYWLPGANAAEILAINFKKIPYYHPKLVSKYLDIHKVLPRLSESSEGAILKIATFPYLGKDQYLDIKSFDIDKHGLILGASGSGKSKLLSLMIARVLEDEELREKYRFLVIDPHASLVSEIGGFSKVVDFENTAVDLFSNNSEAPVLVVELLLEVFRGLLEANWNARLERVLRHSFHLLTMSGRLDFTNLRRILLDLPYRNLLLKETVDLPNSTLDFFKMEYSEIKSRNYMEAVAPIISLIDEVEVIPAFTSEGERLSLSDCLLNNPVTLVSLQHSKLGRKGTQAIAGLIMQQVAGLIQGRDLGRQLIMVVDEVAVVANPVLARLLSEARKFGLHVILIGQYFSMVPEYLRKAILSNVSNYFLFRITKEDAMIFNTAVDMKVPLDNTTERKVRILSRLNNRECVAQVSINGKLQPAIKGETLEFSGVGAELTNLTPRRVSMRGTGVVRTFIFGGETRVSLRYVLCCFSAQISRGSVQSLEKRLISSLGTYVGGHEFQYKGSLR